MANNPFQTPTGTPWAIPNINMNATNPNLVLNTPARVARLVSRWNSGSGVYAGLFTNWSSGTLGPANTGFGHALKYLATGNSTEAINSYNAATAESFVYETELARIYSDSAPYCYAWCKGALSSSQQSTLVTLIDGNNGTRETNIGVLGKYLLDGPGNGNVGMFPYIIGVCAINGVSGATDRRTNLRNFVQNMAQYLGETYGDGWWHSYDYISTEIAACIIAYHIATGEENLLTTRVPWFANRGEILARLLSSNGYQYFRGPIHDAYTNGNCVISSSPPEAAWACAMEADITGDPLMCYVLNQGLAHSTPSPWTTFQPTTDSSWVALLFSQASTAGVDSRAQSPAAAGTATCKAFATTGVAEFRGGWNQATDVVVQYSCGPTAANDHNNQKTSSLTIRVGNTWLLKDGYMYTGRGSPGTWEVAVPITAGAVGNYSMCSSGIAFMPTANASTNPDRASSCSITAGSSSSTDYPLSNSLTNGVRQTWTGGSLGAMTDNGSVAEVVGTFTKSFQQITSGNTTVGFVRGATTDVCTVVLWDQFVVPGTIGSIWRNFWSFNKPTISGETVLQGASTAGVLSATGDNVVIANGSYWLTVQLISASGINCVGGLGYESFFDGYASGGANLPAIANAQNPSDSRLTTEWPYMQGQWRTRMVTTSTTEMVAVLTVTAAGTSAPSYTRTTALALLSASGAPVIMPGMSQYQNGKLLTATVNQTLYAAAFTTVGQDNGTGFVEPSGANGYARVAVTFPAWGTPVLGSPSSISTVSAITFPGNTGSNWGNIQGNGFFDAPTGGNLIASDYAGSGKWQPATVTLASPGVITCEGHGFSNGDLVAVTVKYGGTLPTLSSGSWGGLQTVENVTTNTFDVGLNTTSVGSFSVKKVTQTNVTVGNQFVLAAGQATLYQA